ncbi:hypothetical protein [Acidovorax sp. CCYZU-2555]|uniref:hypothetical protein n=1 Tax=Acidovorax sp. CCYZU-2555 TaxID=2835042 RepID=UPI001BD083FE|nr:hypothetical protein [Acidovorax sp. CCYZU-2555]MBS7781350.1 hypothetical protein [Acidovorax sp. CCYZU-2555]
MRKISAGWMKFRGIDQAKSKGLTMYANENSCTDPVRADRMTRRALPRLFGAPAAPVACLGAARGTAFSPL